MTITQTQHAENFHRTQIGVVVDIGLHFLDVYNDKFGWQKMGERVITYGCQGNADLINIMHSQKLPCDEWVDGLAIYALIIL